MENPDILECLSKHQSRPQLVVGFAAETEDLIKNARAKMEKKGCDWILANDVSGGSVFGKDTTSIHFITPQEVEDWPQMNKKDVAARLAVKVAEFFGESTRPQPQTKIKAMRTLQ
jgi:phosphopantothenoylcysteine decarboxylase/phosphopantothenate--cysteine ligase